MDKDTRIQHLNNDIKVEIDLETSLATARSNFKNCPTFQSFVNFLTEEVEHKMIRKEQFGDFIGCQISG